MDEAKVYAVHQFCVAASHARKSGLNSKDDLVLKGVAPHEISAEILKIVRRFCS